jgi:hypothetical protein
MPPELPMEFNAAETQRGEKDARNLWKYDQLQGFLVEK